MKGGNNGRGRAAEERRGAVGREWYEAGVAETLRMERRRALQGMPGMGDILGDPVDEARKREEEAVWMAVLDRSQDFQVTVEEALRRLADGKYGRCADCGEEIALARLRALPFAIRCLSCQEIFEHKGKAAERRSIGERPIVDAEDLEEDPVE